MESDSEVKEVREGEGEGELGHMITNDFYRTQVNLGSDSWVRLSVSHLRLVRLN